MFNLFATAADVLENNKSKYFIDFQKNNRPSGLGYIERHCVDYFFEAIHEDVKAANEVSVIIVKSINATVIDVSQEGTHKVGTIRYNAVLSVDGEVETIDEFWHFVYDGWNWKLAGIEQPLDENEGE